MEYKIDWSQGKYICVYCGKKFLACYYRKKNYGRTITNQMPGAAKANFIRHLKSCYKKTKEK